MNCPSCGANIELNPGIINYVCPYCNTILFFEHENLKETGQKSSITPFPSALEYGKNYFIIENKKSNNQIGETKIDVLSEQEFNILENKEFILKIYVYGQIRYIAENGIYNKYFVRILEGENILDKNKKIFIEEDEGQIKFYYFDILDKDGTFDKIFNSSSSYEEGYFIQEKGIQNIEGFTGGFDFEIINTKKTRYLNLVGDGGKNFLLEEYPNNILFGTGI